MMCYSGLSLVEWMFNVFEWNEWNIKLRTLSTTCWSEVTPSKFWLCFGWWCLNKLCFCLYSFVGNLCASGCLFCWTISLCLNVGCSFCWRLVLSNQKIAFWSQVVRFQNTNFFSPKIINSKTYIKHSRNFGPKSH